MNTIGQLAKKSRIPFLVHEMSYDSHCSNTWDLDFL